MRKYKLNTKLKKPIPSDEVINKHKNFNDLRMQYSEIVKRPKQPLYKNRKLFLFLLLIAVIAWIIAEMI